MGNSCLIPGNSWCAAGKEENIITGKLRLLRKFVSKKKTIFISFKTQTNMENTTFISNLRLTEHFTLGEFTRSITAERLGIRNEPDWEQIEAMRHLCQEVLEPLRQHYGQPIRITSGYRCPALNEAVSGVGNSQHMLGEAADLSVPSEEVAREWFQWIVRHTEFDQLLFEHSRRLRNRWLHISCKPDNNLNRHQSIFNYQV